MNEFDAKEGWIVNDGTMPDCERVDTKWAWADENLQYDDSPNRWAWADTNLTHWRPAKAPSQTAVYQADHVPDGVSVHPEPAISVNTGVTKEVITIFRTSDGQEYDDEKEAIEWELDEVHGVCVNMYEVKGDDAQAVALFKRLLELRK